MEKLPLSLVSENNGEASPWFLFKTNIRQIEGAISRGTLYYPTSVIPLNDGYNYPSFPAGIQYNTVYQWDRINSNHGGYTACNAIWRKIQQYPPRYCKGVISRSYSYLISRKFV